MTNTKRDAAYAATEAAIQALAGYRLDDDEVVTDAVVLIAAQHIDDDGDRCGRVFVFPRHGYQPVYITKGMLVDALDLIRHARDSEH